MRSSAADLTIRILDAALNVSYAVDTLTVARDRARAEVGQDPATLRSLDAAITAMLSARTRLLVEAEGLTALA